MKYIFTPFIDISIFFLPGFLCLAFFLHRSETSESLLLSLSTLIILGILDSGHVYTSLWRTYFYSKEFKRKPIFYVLLPLFIFLFFLSWTVYGQALLLGNFIFYAAVHHNFKQFLGISKWYQKINSCYNTTANRLFVFLCLIPLTGLHFRERADFQFLNLEIFSFLPNENLLLLSRLSYWILASIWLSLELRSLKQSKGLNLPRVLSIGLPSLLYGLCFLYGTGIKQVLFPLVAAHGVAYIALILKSTKALQITFFWKYSGILVLATAVIFGLFVFFFAPNRTELKSSIFIKAIVGSLFLTPLFCHYIYDSYLWLSSHPDSARVAKS